MTPELDAGKLLMGPDSTYYSSANGKHAVIRLKVDKDGTPIPQVASLEYAGETYTRTE